MSMKEILKAKICINKLEPNFSFPELLDWAELFDKQLMLKLLDEIPTELNTEEQQIRNNISDPVIWITILQAVINLHKKINKKLHSMYHAAPG
ncbi:MAG: hypothetical protein V4660_17055 [Pseudomonadota bacterium]